MRIITVILPVIFAFFQAKGQDSAYILEHINIIDVRTGKVNSDCRIKIAGKRIVDISAQTISCTNCKKIDARGKYIIPGLWDMHVHIRGMESLFFPLLVMNGVTGIRDMHNPGRCYTAGEWRDSINNSSGIAPRIGAVAGCIVDGPGDGRNYGFLVARTPDEGRTIVDTLKKSGADFIKVYEDLDADVYRAIVDESKKQHIPFAGHIPHSIEPAEAAAAGQKSIEHLEDFSRYWSSAKDNIFKFYKDSFLTATDKDFDRIAWLKLNNFDPVITTAICKKLAEYGTFVDPTLVIDMPRETKKELRDRNILSQKDIPGTIEAWFRDKDIVTDTDKYYAVRFQRELNLVQYFKKAKVSLLTGTDMSAIHSPVPGYSLHDELELFVAGGLTPLEALQTATINPAVFLNREDELGTVEKGKFADLIILNANPLTRIQNISNIIAVINNGRYLDRHALDNLKLQAIQSIEEKR